MWSNPASCVACRAFGNGVASIVLSSLSQPNWAVILAWAFAITQIVGTTQVWMPSSFGFTRMLCKEHLAC